MENQHLNRWRLILGGETEQPPRKVSHLRKFWCLTKIR
jgi:hypothetical protein